MQTRTEGDRLDRVRRPGPGRHRDRTRAAVVTARAWDAGPGRPRQPGRAQADRGMHTRRLETRESGRDTDAPEALAPKALAAWRPRVGSESRVPDRGSAAGPSRARQVRRSRRVRENAFLVPTRGREL